MLLESENSVLLIIDIQEKLLNAVFNRDELIKNSLILTKSANILNIPIIVTEQYPKGLGSTVLELKENLAVEKSFIFEKTNFNALEENSILERLNLLNKHNVIVCGIETHICVYQTAKALIDKGYNVTIIKNSCGSRKEYEHLSSLDVLKSYGAEIKTTEMVLFEILKSSKHPNFKEIQSLVK